MKENYVKLISALKNKKDNLKKQFNDLGDKFDNAKTKDEKKSIRDEMLKIKDEIKNLDKLRKEYKQAVWEYNQLKNESTVDQDKLNDKAKVVSDYEKKVANYCHVDIKNVDNENTKTDTPENQKKQEEEKPLEKGKIYKVKEIAHKVGDGLAATGKAIDKGVKFTSKALSITLTSVLALVSILSGIGALSALFGSAGLIGNLIGTAIYGGISYFAGAAAIASSKTFTASKIEGDALKNLIESTKEAKKKK